MPPKRVKKETAIAKPCQSDVTPPKRAKLIDKALPLGKTFQWSPVDVIAEEFCEGDVALSDTICSMFVEGCSIPFISRYRRECTQGKMPDELRNMQEAFSQLELVQSKALTLAQTLSKDPKVTPKVIENIGRAKTIDQLSIITAPFTKGSSKTLAEKAKELGLEPLASSVMKREDFNLTQFIKPQVEGLQTRANVQENLVQIISNWIGHSTKVLELTSRLESYQGAKVVSSKARATKAAEAKKLAAKVDEDKYENYLAFKKDVCFVDTHQVLALVRGQKQKVLSVKIELPPQVEQHYIKFCSKMFGGNSQSQDFRIETMGLAINDSYDRFAKGRMIRNIWSKLTDKAQKDSIEVFCKNLRQLLLMPSCPNTIILGLDPGYRQCKYAVISETGEIVDYGVFRFTFPNVPQRVLDQFVEVVNDHSVTLIALGNGTACRETEKVVSDVIQSGEINEDLEIKYSIVNEQGASIYSCSKLAMDEHPGLDPLYISAASIARRVQDPLSEYVKIEPKHLGIGMYQHDLSEAKLKKNLEEIMTECVSFAGVDINFASCHVLEKVAGLSKKIASDIIKWRESNKGFTSRKELNSIKGIGPKTFEQCAGFVRIFPNRGERPNLDAYLIHPESYELARSIIKIQDLSESQLGSQKFQDHFKALMTHDSMMKRIAQALNKDLSTIELIVEAFSQPLRFDIRDTMDKPVFKTGVRSVQDLKVGAQLQGVVSNVTNFGAFVDIGVSRNGLIHQSQMMKKELALGQKVTVMVLSVEPERGRIGLKLLA
ncbi:S1 RNA-binding domain-containing protein 1-like isoform X1 [Tigriopus californicus]|uniref:S1 RNA-binding domain-containing protein 1-like isoform X1 n=1 Tax=Tigriopus californicus TaxID=6832 RepID=UPI0027DA4909|nr:S1 RNA-binding domain-containing protein 1-like isoform X1 [Tigriopus californicus]